MSNVYLLAALILAMFTVVYLKSIEKLEAIKVKEVMSANPCDSQVLPLVDYYSKSCRDSGIDGRQCYLLVIQLYCGKKVKLIKKKKETI